MFYVERALNLSLWFGSAVQTHRHVSFAPPSYMEISAAYWILECEQ